MILKEILKICNTVVLNSLYSVAMHVIFSHMCMVFKSLLMCLFPEDVFLISSSWLFINIVAKEIHFLKHRSKAKKRKRGCVTFVSIVRQCSFPGSEVGKVSAFFLFFFFSKGPDRKYFRLCRLTSLCCSIQLCSKSSHLQSISKGLWQCLIKLYFLKTDGELSESVVCWPLPYSHVLCTFDLPITVKAQTIYNSVKLDAPSLGSDKL